MGERVGGSWRSASAGFTARSWRGGVMTPRPTSLELFTGAGGLALGLDRAGFHHLAVVELTSTPAQYGETSSARRRCATRGRSIRQTRAGSTTGSTRGSRCSRPACPANRSASGANTGGARTSATCSRRSSEPCGRCGLKRSSSKRQGAQPAELPPLLRVHPPSARSAHHRPALGRVLASPQGPARA